MAAALVCAAAPSALAATVEVRCPGMPLTVEENLWARASRLLADSGMAWATIGLECQPSGAWLVWVDGSRMGIDQTRGVVQGVLDLIQSRLAADRLRAAYIPPALSTRLRSRDPTVEHTTHSSRPTKKSERQRQARQKRGTEGGVGIATVRPVLVGHIVVGSALAST